MSKGLVTERDGIKIGLNAMLTRARTLSSFLQRHTLNQFKRAQVQRWITENSSEGSQWAAVKEPYKTRKRTKFAQYDGSGNKTMIATGGLYRAATGRGPGFYKLITDTQFVVGVDMEVANPAGKVMGYAQYAAETRPIMEFSDATLREWKKDIADYVARGKQ